MKLSDLIQKLDYKCLQGSADREVTTLVYDSRKIEAGSVFVCVRGAVSDGHDYAAQAAEAGATALIVEHPVDLPPAGESSEEITVICVEDTRVALAETSAAYFGYPANELTTIGVTGTKGKTTATYMIRDILERSGISTGLIGTIETVIGDEEIPALNTTPESYVIQETLRKMADKGLKCVVMEVSSQGLKLHRVDGFVFDYGVFMNLAPDHIGENEHPDFDDYVRCKSLLFKKCRIGILNADDEYLDRILAGHTCEVETYGLSENADLRALDVRLTNQDGCLGVACRLSGALDMDVEIDVPGTFSVYNALAAIAICLHFGVEPETIRRALKEIHVKGRVELVPVSPRFTLMIDYAHNAMSLESLLTTLREYEPKRLVCVFGCGGNRARDRRFSMGEVSSRLADLTIVTSDNPRYEDPSAIIDDILVGVGRADGAFLSIPDRAEAVRYAIEQAEEGDVIVLAGKGHEDYQEIRGKKYHMDDRELVADVVKDGNFLRQTLDFSTRL